MPLRILITGATSAIAGEVAKIYAKQGAAFHLVARNAQHLETVTQDLLALGAAQVTTAALDLDQTESHRELIQQARARLNGIDVVLVAQGLLGDQAVGEHSFANAKAVLNTNFVSVVSLLTELTDQPILDRGACIAMIGSVAGDRGRRSNYIYGASKCGLEAFAEGLRARLYEQGITVTLLKPGFVETPMTAHMTKRPLAVSAGQVARGIAQAIEKRRDVAYLPWFWGPIMQVIRAIPTPLFKRLSF